MNIIKRNGTLEAFNKTKIFNAILRSMNETKIGVDRMLAESIASEITKDFEKQNIPVTVEEVQERVEFALMDSERKDIARQYIIYRNARNRVRKNETKKDKNVLLSDEFISMYKHNSNPFPTQLGEFVYYRTYSRWLPLEQRREYWWETVRRAVEYNCSLVPTSVKEAEELFDNIYNLKQFLSGRTFWVGGTKVATQYVSANFNCAFETIDDFESFRDLFYLLMVGSGVGIRILKDDVAKLPKIRTGINVIHEDYIPIAKDQREDNTSLRFNKNIAYLVVGDSKDGWVQSLDYFFRILYSNEYKNINTVILNYKNVRPKGEPLATFGGTASGHESLKNMFIKIDKIIKQIGANKENNSIKLRPIDCLDFCNIIGENVVIGGVRRTACLALIDSDDNECISAKSNLYQQVDGQWVVDKDIIHRQMSNNSIYYKQKPSRERLHWQIEQMRYSGEPAWVNAEAAEKRRPNMTGLNPCLTGNMRLLTNEGYKSLEELSEKENVKLVDSNGILSEGRVWYTGEKNIFKINLSNVKTLTCTEDHRFMLVNGEECEAKDLKGKRLMPYLNEDSIFNDEYVKYGFIQGDGCLGRLASDSHLGLEINLGKNDEDVADFFGLDRSNNKPYCSGYNDILKQLGFSSEPLPNRIFPSTYDNWTDKQKISFLRGCYSANGSVISTGRITYKTTCKAFALKLQEELSYFDLSSYITTNKKKDVEFNNGTYECKESYDVNIGQYLCRLEFFNRIGFLQKYKMERLKNLLISKSPKVTSVVNTKTTQKVYDFSEPNTHWGVIEGFITHNCCEILLDSKGMCNLTTINCFAFVRANGSLDREGLLNAQRLSARAGYRMTTVDLELPKWDSVQKRDRLTGCSLTGWQDMVNALGYDKNDEILLLQELRKVANEEVKDYSNKLGLEPSLLVTTIKPEGCTTKDHIRTLDNGILFLDEINPNIEEQYGFQKIAEQLTFNGNNISKTYKNDIKDGLRLGFKNGRKLDVTSSHPMSIGNKWTEASFLKVGDILDYKLGFYNNKENVKLIESIYKKVTSAIVEKTPNEMTEDLAWLLGAYFANGSLTTKHRIKFHCQYKEVHEKVQKIWKKLFNVETNIIKLNDRNSYVQDFASANIRSWFEINNLDKTKDFERIPLPIRKSSKEVVLSFIAGYADNDGCFSSKTFCIDSSNESFIRHLQEVGEAVGLSFGISINKKRGEKAFTQNFMYKAHLSRGFSTQESIDYINNHSVKALLKGKIVKGFIRSSNPYKITSITRIESIQTYDIEVENEHWYYQGALKSHNTMSQLPTVSSGVHYSHSPYFIRRVRINSHDPLVKVCEELGYPIHPEVGQTMENCSTKVIEFPVKAPDGRTKYNISALEQLENYKMFMEHYVDQNCSITVHVRDHEWGLVEDWVWDNWDDIVAVSFLSLDDNFYELLPYEAIEKEEYERRLAEAKNFVPSLLSKYESKEVLIDIGNDGCEGGQCPVR